MAKVVWCGECATQVVAKSDGTCPACGGDPFGSASDRGPAIVMPNVERSPAPPAIAMSAPQFVNVVDAADAADAAAGRSRARRTADEIHEQYLQSKRRFQRRTAFWIMLLFLGGTFVSGFFFVTVLRAFRVIHLNLLGLVVFCAVGSVVCLVGWLRGSDVLSRISLEDIEDRLLP